MKKPNFFTKRVLFISSFLIVSSLTFLSTMTTTDAASKLPIDARTGAPADDGGKTCAGCHTGSAVTPTTGVITTNIPSSGYIGGTTYSVSVTMKGAAAYGFELTAQTATSNTGLGTWIAGQGSTVSNKYIKQSDKITGTSAVWTFSWTAPKTAATVTFYGAFNYANNTGNTSGDIIKTSSVTFMANTTGITEASKVSVLSVFPNPTTDILNIVSEELFNQGVIYSVDGKLVKTISEQELVSKSVLVSNLDNGVYYIHMLSSNKKLVAKFAKND